MFSSTSFGRLSLKAGFVTLLGLASLFGAKPAEAGILNGDFETGDFTGWKILGQASIKTSADDSGSTAGTFQALLSTFCPAIVNNHCKKDGNFSAMTKFLSVNALDLTTLGDVFEGSAITTTFRVKAGDILTFDWNFLTDSKDGDNRGLYNDFAFVKLSRRVDELADTYSPFVGTFAGTNFKNQTGFKTYSYSFTKPGIYTLGIGVVDVGDGANDSGLLVDNIAISSPPPPSRIPEPASVLGVLAFAAFGVGSRRSHKAHHPHGRSRRH